jgi:hypothetical protein
MIESPIIGIPIVKLWHQVFCSKQKKHFSKFLCCVLLQVLIWNGTLKYVWKVRGVHWENVLFKRLGDFLFK